MAENGVTYREVKHFLGDIDDHKVAEVIESGATVADLEEVAAHLALQTDVMGELERPLHGRALRIYELVRRDEESLEEDR